MNYYSKIQKPLTKYLLAFVFILIGFNNCWAIQTITVCANEKIKLTPTKSKNYHAHLWQVDLLQNQPAISPRLALMTKHSKNLKINKNTLTVGSYFVTLTLTDNSSGCIDIDTIIIIVENCNHNHPQPTIEGGNNNSIEEELAIELNLFPNPTTDLATISYELPQDYKTALVVHNIAGARVKTLFTNRQQKKGEYQFGLNDLSPGVYTISLYLESSTSMAKIITKKLIVSSD